MLLGETNAIKPGAMINLAGALPDASEMLKISDAHLHRYDKAIREDRKVGHVTVRAETPALLAQRLNLFQASSKV